MSNQGIFVKVLANLELASFAAQIQKAKDLWSGAASDMDKAWTQSNRAAKLATDEVAAAMTNLARDTDAAAAAEARLEAAALRRANSTKAANAEQLAALQQYKDARAGGDALAIEAARVNAAENNASRMVNAYNAEEVARQKLGTANKVVAASADEVAAAQARQTEVQDASTASAANANRGMTLLAGGTALVGLGFLETGKKASDFQQKIALLNTAGGELTKNNQLVSQGILDMSSKYGVSANKLAEAMLGVETAGYHGADALKVLEVSTQTSLATHGELRDVVDALTTAYRDYHTELDKTPEVASNMVAAAQVSKKSFTEIARSFYSFDPTAMRFGVGQNEVLAMLASAVHAGFSPQMAGQDISSLIKTLGKPSKSTIASLGQIGLSADDLSKMVSTGDTGALQAVRTIINQVDSMSENGLVNMSAMYRSPDLMKSMQVIRSQVKSPAGQKIMDDVLSGKVSAFGMGKGSALGAIKEQDPGEGSMILQFLDQFRKLTGVSDQIRAGESLQETRGQVLQELLHNSAAGNMLSVLGAFKPGNAMSAESMFAHINEAKPDPNGDVLGTGQQMDTTAIKLQKATEAYHNAVIAIGTAAAPALVAISKTLETIGNIFEKHPFFGQEAGWAAVVTGGLWLIVKAGKGINEVFTVGNALYKKVFADMAVDAAVGAGKVVATQREIQTVVEETSVQVGALNKELAAGEVLGGTAGGGIGAGMKKAGEEAEKTEKKVSNIGTKLKGLSSMVFPLFIALNVYEFVHDIAKDLADATDATPELHGSLVHDQGARGRFSPPNRKPKQNDPVGSGRHRPFSDPGWMGTRTSEIAPGVGEMPSDLGPDNITPPIVGGGDSSSTIPGPTGDSTDPLTVSIKPDELNKMIEAGKTNATDGTTYGKAGDMSVMNPLEQLKSGGFSLSNIAKVMTTFLMELALGNPLGHLLTGTSMFGDQGQAGQDAAATPTSPDDIANMTDSQRKAIIQHKKLQKAIDTYWRLQNTYAADLAKYGPNDYRTVDAEIAALDARDNIDTTYAGQLNSNSKSQATLSAAQAKLQALIAAGVSPSDPKYIAALNAVTNAQNNVPDTGGDATSAVIDPGAPFDPSGYPVPADDAGLVPGTHGFAGLGSGVHGLLSGRGRGRMRGIRASGGMDGSGGGVSGGYPMPEGAGTTYSRAKMQQLGIPPLYNNPGSGASPTIPQWVQDFVHEHGGPDLVAGSTPHGSLHGNAGGPGWAVDVVGKNGVGSSMDQQDRLAKYLEANSALSAMMIHQASDGEDFGIAGGQNVPKGTYFTTPGGTYRDEAGMVHWAPSSGGSGFGPMGGGGVPQHLGGGRGKMRGFGPMGQGPMRQGPPIGGNPANAGSPTPSNQAQPVDYGSGGGGIGAGSGLMGMAEGALTTAAGLAGTAASFGNPLAGAATSFATQVATQELNNVANYVGKLAGIGVDAVAETFHISDPDGGGGGAGGQGWIAKIAGGLAGGHPQGGNTAGTATQPPVKPDEAHAGAGAAPGPTNNQNVTINNHQVTDPVGASTKMNQALTQFPMMFQG